MTSKKIFELLLYGLIIEYHHELADSSLLFLNEILVFIRNKHPKG